MLEFLIQELKVIKQQENRLIQYPQAEQVHTEVVKGNNVIISSASCAHQRSICEQLPNPCVLNVMGEFKRGKQRTFVLALCNNAIICIIERHSKCGNSISKFLGNRRINW